MKITTERHKEISLRYYHALNFIYNNKACKLLSTKHPKNVQVKPDGSLVTEIDKEIDRAFRLGIYKHPRFSQDEIISEEGENEYRPAKYTWIIDPLDGTANFVNNRFPYAISIGFWVDNEPTFGIIAQKETSGLTVLSASIIEGPTKGLYWDAEKKKIPPSLPIKLMGGIDFRMSNEDKLLKAFPALLKETREMRVIGSIVCGLSAVALGRLSFYIHSSPQIWDVATSLVLLQESGRVTNLGKIDLAQIAQQNFMLPMVVAAQNEEILSKVLDIINFF